MQNLKPIKVVVVDDQQIIVHCLVILLNTIDRVNVIGWASNGSELMGLMETIRPDVVLMDINMPVLNGIEATRLLDEKMPWVKVIALYTNDHRYYVRRMFKNGARGVISKNAAAEQLGTAIAQVYNGELYIQGELAELMLLDEDHPGDASPDHGSPFLTPREFEIIQLLSDGFYTKEIAEKLFISDKTVERHKTNILWKLKARNTAHLVRLAIGKGIISI